MEIISALRLPITSCANRIKGFGDDAASTVAGATPETVSATSQRANKMI
ncbi:hypothetical protein [Rhizobium sp. IBUN]|nr:hypothetical protein [Rhizobium sp. IBUN]